MKKQQDGRSSSQGNNVRSFLLSHNVVKKNMEDVEKQKNTSPYPGRDILRTNLREKRAKYF